jgi:hypothetical protein
MKAQKIISKIAIVWLLTFSIIPKGNSQIVLDIRDLPDIGDQQVSVKVDSLQASNLLPGNAGANVQWDFRNLKPCCGVSIASHDTVFWENHATSANAAFFPLSNLVRTEKCRIYHSHTTHQDEKECSFTHYIIDSNGLWRYGMEDPKNFLFVSNWNIFPLLSYGDSLKTVTKLHVPVSNDSIRVYHILNSSVADAWGVISTPDTTASVIRIYTAEVVYDSLFVKGNLIQSDVYTGNYYYRWYSKNLGFPVLEIGKGMQIQKPPFYQKVNYSSHKNTILSVPENDILNRIKIFPNPFSSYINISLGENFKNASISIFDLTGQMILKVTNLDSEDAIRTTELSPGIYFYVIVNRQQEIIRGKIIKNNF